MVVAECKVNDSEFRMELNDGRYTVLEYVEETNNPYDYGGWEHYNRYRQWARTKHMKWIVVATCNEADKADHLFANCIRSKIDDICRGQIRKIKNRLASIEDIATLQKQYNLLWNKIHNLEVLISVVKAKKDEYFLSAGTIDLWRIAR